VATKSGNLVTRIRKLDDGYYIKAAIQDLDSHKSD